MLFKSVTCNSFATKQFIDLCLTLTLCLFCPFVCHFFSLGPGHDNILPKFADIVERNFLGPKTWGRGPGSLLDPNLFLQFTLPTEQKWKVCCRVFQNLHTRSLRIQSSHDTCTFWLLMKLCFRKYCFDTRGRQTFHLHNRTCKPEWPHPPNSEWPPESEWSP